MICIVQKEFVGGGETFVKNQVFDSGGFRNEQALIAQRYLRPATPQEIASAVPEDELHTAPAVPLRAKKAKGLKVRRAKR